MKFDRVMVPVDGSIASKIAVELAVNSAGTFATHLTFVYVIDEVELNYGSMDANEYYLRLKMEGELTLDSAAKLASEKGIDYETVMKRGIPSQVLVELTKEQDMVIMAISGKSGLASGRIGTIARKTIENSFCPVLTLKSGSSKITDILLPVYNENVAAIDVAIETARRINGRITVMSVKSKKNPDPVSIANAVAEKCSAANVDVDTCITEGSPLDAMVGESGKYDLIVMGVQKAGVLKNILHGGLTERVVMMSSCPVTVVRDV